MGKLTRQGGKKSREQNRLQRERVGQHGGANQDKVERGDFFFFFFLFKGKQFEGGGKG